MSKVSFDPTTQPLFQVKDKPLYYKDKIYIPPIKALRHNIF